ncbi:TPA: hypothetical protein ACTXAP_004747 [Raoultella planticola]
MRDVTTETVRERMNELGQRITTDRISLREEFELSCLRELLALMNSKAAADNPQVIPGCLPDGINIYHRPKEETILVVRQDTPVIPDGYVMVPKTLTPKMITRLQLKSEIGGYIAANWAAAYSCFQEFWDIAIAAATQGKN